MQSGVNNYDINRPNLVGLTSLRFIAATLVVIEHYTFRFELFSSKIFLGYEAVTFFFILSGFILTYVYAPYHVTDNIRTSLRRFYVARAARVLPVYYLALLISLPWYIYSFFIDKHSVIEFTVGFFLVLLMLQSWIPLFSLHWNDPAWSLSVEMLFYITFPMIFRLTRFINHFAMLFLSLFLIFLFSIVKYYLGLFADGVQKSYLILYFPLFHLPYFIFGMALGKIFVYNQFTFSKYSFHVFIATCIFLYTISLFDVKILSIFSSSVIALVCASIIMAFAHPPKILTDFLSHKFMILLGESSYGLYLLHYPILLWYGFFIRGFSIHIPFWLDFALYFSLCIVFSVLCFKYVENPSRHFINK